MKTQRADVLLVEKGLASTRSQAQRLIASGVQWRLGAHGPWSRVAKNGEEIPAQAELQLQDAAEARFVSRGGLKLDGALETLGLVVQGKLCLDVGQSTGGFTDCLLQHGAARVVGVDVGHGQLHENMRNDERVTAVESVNARELTAEHVGEDFDVVTGDLSFISLTLVLPSLVPLMKPGAALLMLVKPQFELQPPQIGRGGIVKDAAFYPVVEQRIRDACASLGLRVTGWFDSPIEGGDGNREFFVFACKPDEEGA